MMSDPHQRSGFTLLEVLVAVTVIGLLAAILVPAVQRVREASRLAQCRDRVRGFGAALSNYEAVHRALPPAIPATGRQSQPGSYYSEHNYSPHIFLLPYLGEEIVFNGFDLSRPQLRIESFGQLPASAAHQLAVFRCPSDSGAGFGSNYRFSTGDQAHAIQGGGAFSDMVGIKLAKVVDGLSMTAALSERAGSDDAHGRFNRQEDFWISSASTIDRSILFDVDRMVFVCSGLDSEPTWYMSRVGHQWLNAGYAFAWYNHAVPPNSPIPDCSSGMVHHVERVPQMINSAGGVHKASSRHVGGVNVLYLDGSMKFVSDSVDLTIWRAAATIAGREVNSRG